MGEAALRADARRNRERLLTVTRQVVAEEGANVSLRDIARRAEVGIGTLYRHFPTREALLDAALRDGLESLTAEADEGLLADSPGEALLAWLERFSARSRAWCALPMPTGQPGTQPELQAASRAMAESVARLLTRAQDAGQVRRDVDAGDLLATARAIGWLSEHTEPDRVTRILAVIHEGLTTDGP
ncbi:TetR/AcrR family transcriptional regulator [Actinomadura sp. 9N215]|uniref:TetR/AcrR family transcriptional regulator n=1 Tax=Actinomadura sp. 9N215 TaxID=3375150 RepID=UPI00378DBC4C